MFKSNLLFSKSLLNKIYYHWLWGLSYGESNDFPSFGKLLFESGQDVESIRLRQQEIIQYNPVIRFIFWLFNIDNYRSNNYLLYAYDGYKEYNKYNDNEKDREVYIDKSNDISVNSIENHFRHKLNLWKQANHNLVQEDHVPRKSEKTARTTSTSRNSNDADNNKVLKVNTEIQKFLLDMNISKELGEVVSWREVVSAYRKGALQCHPDRPNGNSEGWLKLSSANQKLTEKFFPVRNCLRIVTQKDVDAVFSKINALKERLDRIRRGIDELNKGITNVGEKINDVQERSKNFYKSVADDFARLNSNIDEGIERVETFRSEIRKDMERVETFRRDIREGKERIETFRREIRQDIERVETFRSEIREDMKRLDSLKGRVMELIKRNEIERQEQVKKKNATFSYITNLVINMLLSQEKYMLRAFPTAQLIANSFFAPSKPITSQPQVEEQQDTRLLQI